MKKILFYAVAVVMMLGAASCSNNDDNNNDGTPDQGEVKTATEQKSRIESISAEIQSIVKPAECQQAQRLGAYYANTLSGYNTAAVKLRCGGAASLVEAMFSSLPSSNCPVGEINWSILLQNAEFRANATTKKWEFTGEGNRDGIYFRFTDDQNHDCYIRIAMEKEHIGLLKGSRKATVELYSQNELVAYCNASCVSNGITDLTSDITVGYGPVKNIVQLSSKSGEYGVVEKLTYGDRSIVTCTVTASGVKFTTSDNLISSYRHVTVDLDVINRMQVVANVESSIPDLFAASVGKDYITKLQEYLDKNVDVKVYYTGTNGAQAEITLLVEKTGTPLFGKAKVVPYIHFLSDDTTMKLSAYIESSSYLPDFLRHLEEVLGNIQIQC
ncbi:MAG: hypothetical protein HUK06_05405 [Bacteroidaceae bacterium]|nr:hypothetical protein [Bacteroidaceae bacterium]